ncbi:hypothetical protein P7C70_g6242, partial [Phenoliferia sp. Uapishka_3]
MQTQGSLPGEIVSKIISNAVAPLPQSAPLESLPQEPATRRALLLSTSLVSKTWRIESQRLLFRSESRLETQEQIKAWSIAAGRFTISEVSSGDWTFASVERSAPTPEAERYASVSACESFVDSLSLLRVKQLGLTVLRISARWEDSAFNLPIMAMPINPPRFSLISLDLQLDLRRAVKKVVVEHTDNVLRALETSVKQAKEIFIKIESDAAAVGLRMPRPVALSTSTFLVRNLISAASHTLETLRLGNDHSSIINGCLNSLRTLQNFFDGARGTREDMKRRILSLPKSLQSYHIESTMPDYLTPKGRLEFFHNARIPMDVVHPEDEDEAVEELIYIFMEALLEDDGLLPNLAVTDSWKGYFESEDSDEQICQLEEELSSRRPCLKLVDKMEGRRQ